MIKNISIRLSEKTHKKLKLRCVKEDKTFDKLLSELVDK